MGDVGRILDVYMLIFFLVLPNKSFVLHHEKQNDKKLFGIDFKRPGPDVCIPQIVLCVLAAEIVDVQIENALVCMRCRRERSQCSDSTITLL